MTSIAHLTRRRFAQWIGVGSALGLVAPHVAAGVLLEDKRRLGWLANRTAQTEGAWALTKIEGKVPKELNGTLYRTAPGQKDNHGVTLQHLFDGDAFVCGYSFREGKVNFRARFVETPQRLEELKAKRMLYNEFGTVAPPPPPEMKDWKPAGGKNQPSVNIIAWDGLLLGLSEGGHPTAIDPATLGFQGFWNFHGTLPQNNPFTAHPKFDPATGAAYGYGVRRGPGLPLTVYRMELDGKLTQLYALPQKTYPIIHDMLLSKDHIIFVIPPVNVDFIAATKGKIPADILLYAEKEPTRLVVLRKDGTGKPVTIEQPPGFVFHHGNAFEHDGKIVIDTFMSPDASILELIYSFSKDRLPVPSPIKFTRLTLDTAKGVAESKTEFGVNEEFPRFDERRAGQDARFLYTLDANRNEDSFAFSALIRHDLHAKTSKRIEAGKGRAVGEAVFVPYPGQDSEERGWLLQQGYDAGRDENYLEIRDAQTLDPAARIWTGIHFPLGFHGNFSTKSFITT